MKEEWLCLHWWLGGTESKLEKKENRTVTKWYGSWATAGPSRSNGNHIVFSSRNLYPNPGSKYTSRCGNLKCVERKKKPWVRPVRRHAGRSLSLLVICWCPQLAVPVHRRAGDLASAQRSAAHLGELVANRQVGTKCSSRFNPWCSILRCSLVKKQRNDRCNFWTMVLGSWIQFSNRKSQTTDDLFLYFRCLNIRIQGKGSKIFCVQKQEFFLNRFLNTGRIMNIKLLDSAVYNKIWETKFKATTEWGEHFTSF